MRASPAISDLTPTQRRVAELVAVGASYKDIAKTLRMHHSTARVHVNAISAKLPEDDLTPYRRVMIWAISQTIHARV
jgi:DNA-binding NarL/FixJ family response regulator